MYGAALKNGADGDRKQEYCCKVTCLTYNNYYHKSVTKIVFIVFLQNVQGDSFAATQTVDLDSYQQIGTGSNFIYKYMLVEAELNSLCCNGRVILNKFEVFGKGERTICSL